MPGADLGYDHAEIRVLAAAVGQREAARQLGMSENTVKSICYRAGDGETLAVAVQVKTEKSLHPTAPRAADVLANTLKERLEKTKLGQSKYLARASEALADVPDDELLVQAATGKLLADMASKVYPEQSGVLMRISATQSPVIDIEAEVIEQEPQQ